MSREKFEEWFNKQGFEESWRHEFELCWLAGRESMRHEAASLLQSKHEELGLFHYKIAKAHIEKIAP